MASAWLLAVAAGCLAATASGRPAALYHGAVPPSGYYDVVADCGADPSGATDSTAAIQGCVNRAFAWNATPPITAPVFFPLGTYTVNDTIVLQLRDLGTDDGINVVPGRYLSIVLWGSGEALPSRPTLRLAPASAGFGAPGTPKAVLQFPPPIGGGEGVEMNNLVKGLDIDLTAAGNPGAVGLQMAGAQGATATDITVYAAPETFACFRGCNGAGGMHSNIACYNARYGVYIDDAQPGPSIVGALLVNQSVAAVTFFAQETASFVGLNVTLAPGAAGPAVSSPVFAGGGGYSHAISVQDSVITCDPSVNATAVGSQSTTYLRDVWMRGCGTAVDVRSAAPIPAGSSSSTQWLHVAEYAKGVNSSNPYLLYDVIYQSGVRTTGAVLSSVAVSAGGPPTDLISRHLWDEVAFPRQGMAGVADAKEDCGAKGDDMTDDQAALQACLDTHGSVYLPPGIYRLGATLQLPAGAAIVGMGNTMSVLAATSSGVAGASPASPVPLVATSSDDAGAAPTILAFVGITIFQHLPDTYALDWASRNPASLWRVGYESRPCECLWVSDWQETSPPAIPCSLPVNLTIPKTVFRGLGRVHAWVTDDTGGILSTGHAYRHMIVRDTAAFAGPDARLRFYSLNLEHAQAEANGEVINASFVDIHSVKAEGNLPILWIRSPASNISVMALAGGFTPLPFNATLPPDFAPSPLPATFMVDPGVGVTFATLVDHGFGSQAPYWPPTGGGCRWEHHYPYPGAAVPQYPFWTYPNVTMWNCWFGSHVATSYFHVISLGANGTTPGDKPALYRTW